MYTLSNRRHPVKNRGLREISLKHYTKEKRNQYQALGKKNVNRKELPHPENGLYSIQIKSSCPVDTLSCAINTMKKNATLQVHHVSMQDLVAK